MLDSDKITKSHIYELAVRLLEIGDKKIVDKIMQLAGMLNLRDGDYYNIPSAIVTTYNTMLDLKSDAGMDSSEAYKNLKENVDKLQELFKNFDELSMVNNSDCPGSPVRRKKQLVHLVRESVLEDENLRISDWKEAQCPSSCTAHINIFGFCKGWY